MTMRTEKDPPAAGMGKFADLDLDQITPSPTNPRGAAAATNLGDLTASIRVHGVLQPILVRPLKALGTYEIVAGERRWRAAKAAGLRTIPTRIRDLTDAEAFECQAIENLQRQDLHPLEEARGYQQLMRVGKHDVARIAERVGRSVKYVYDRVKLLSLTKEAQRLFLEGKIAAGHAILLARLKPADQARAMDPDKGGLFETEHLLWDPNLHDDEDTRPRPAAVKPRSVRELQGWIDQHVKFDAAADDLPDLFPETAVTLTAAREQTEKIVPITHEYMTPPDARDGQRVYTQRSWKRADGTGAGKTCEHAVTGVIVIGPGRGDAFKVCVEKKKCKIHWAAEQREAKKRAKAAAKGGATGEDRWKAEQRQREKARKVEEAKRARFLKARPAILKAVAERVLKVPVGAGSQLADIVVKAVTPEWGGRPPGLDLVPRGQTAEDLVRHAAWISIGRQANDYQAFQHFPKLAKVFGVDVARILDDEAPVQTSAPVKAKASKEPRRGKASRKKAVKGKAAPAKTKPEPEASA